MQATGKKPPSEWVSCGSSRGEKVMHPGKSGVQRTLSPVSLAKKSERHKPCAADHVTPREE